MQSMRDDDFDRFISTSLKEEAQAHQDRLVLMEARVLSQLRPAPKRLVQSTPSFRWGVATVGAMACLLIGVTLGVVITQTMRKPEAVRVAVASHKCGPIYDNSLSTCEFFVFDDKAESIELVASFTGWAPIALTKTQPGVWTGTFSVQGSGQRYAFLIDGQNWQIYKGCPKAFEFMGRQECVLNL
jgi:hypothetical protein